MLNPEPYEANWHLTLRDVVFLCYYAARSLPTLWYDFWQAVSRKASSWVTSVVQWKAQLQECIHGQLTNWTISPWLPGFPFAWPLEKACTFLLLQSESIWHKNCTILRGHSTLHHNLAVAWKHWAGGHLAFWFEDVAHKHCIPFTMNACVGRCFNTWATWESYSLFNPLNMDLQHYHPTKHNHQGLTKDWRTNVVLPVICEQYV